jgi:hypothetical protein
VRGKLERVRGCGAAANADESTAPRDIALGTPDALHRHAIDYIGSRVRRCRLEQQEWSRRACLLEAFGHRLHGADSR